MITPETTVKEAVESSPGAPKVFEQFGINPKEKCSGMYDMVSLEDAIDWCHIGTDLESLVAALNAAIENNGN